MSLSRRALGAQFEQRARLYLEQQGLQFIAANVTLRGGELDLIMLDGYDWVFVEVRFRRHAHLGSAVDSVTPTKQRRLYHSASLWLHQRGQSIDTANCRFDIVAFDGPDARISWYQNILHYH
ncbi:YraN family protein [Plesiomonas shigelloides]|uniref:YraN family protein n=1 Tax=Plesiomonas shigelloides TaxID=703 RepID=UPI00288464DA|nr:YraN family protein [Plesiomonas shigelloides]MDT1011983.1 YraN family protein [Plesiomonas shigelloides]